MSYRSIVVAGLVAGLVGGCQETAQRNENAIGGAAIGAIAGAALGTLAGGNDARNAAIGASIGLVAGAAIGSYLDQQQADLERDLAGTGAEVRRVNDSIYVNLPGGVTFDVDSDRISRRFYRPLDRVAGTLRRYDRTTIDVVGHTDSTGSDEYNLALSRDRAYAVSDYMLDRGVPSGRLYALGVGERYPIASNATPEGRRANRRVEIRITPIES